MDYIQPNDMLHLSVKLYRIIGETFGEYSRNDSMKVRIFRCVTCSLLILNCILTAGSFIQADGEMYIKSLESSMTIMHTLVKYMHILYYKGNIKDLMQEVKYFWNYQRCGPKIHARLNNVHKIVRRCQKWMTIGPISLSILFFLRPAFNSKNKFIFYSWTPWNSALMDALFLFTQYYLTALMTSIVFGCDFLYVSYSVHVASQIYLLNCEFESLKDKNCDADLYEYIRHHQLILSIFRRMKNTFFWLLLFHYFVSLLSGCSQMYLIMLGQSKPMDLLATGVYFCCIFIEFAYYSFPVEIIVSELQHIATSIYMSSWVDMKLTRRKLLLLVMMRAQRQSYLSIGGIMDMNVDAFGSVVRKVFSFCALLKNILNN